MEEKKIRMDRDEFAGALKVVERIVQVREKALVARYSNVLLEADAGSSRLTVVASDDVQTAVARVNAGLDEDVRMVVPGRLLIDYVRALPSRGSIKLTPRDGDRKDGQIVSVEVECGEHRCTIPVVPTGEENGDEYGVPAMDDEVVCRATVPGELFSSVVQVPASVARQADASTTLAGVHVVVGESAIRLDGCDGIQAVVAYADLSSERDGLSDKTDANLPAGALADLARHVTADEDVEVIIGASRAAIICRAGEFYLQQVAGDYPDVEKLIPKENAASAVVPNELFRQSLKAVAVLSRQQRGINPMRVTLEEDAVVLDYKGPERSGVEALASGTARIAAETELPAGGTHAVVDVGFIASHAAAVPSGADLRVGLGGPANPITVRSSFGNDAASARLAYAVSPMAAAEGSAG